MNIGLIIFKKEENEFKFLLGKKNLKTLNMNNDLYSDLGGNSDNDDINQVKDFFNDHTFNLLDIGNFDNKYEFKNDKYNYKLYFLESDISDSKLETVIKVRNNINKNTEDDVKWFSLDNIIENKELFEKDFFNTFIKAVKKYKDNFIKV